jgi:serine/threonine-protein kinase RsbW
MRAVVPTDVEFEIPAEGEYAVLVRKGIRSLAAAADFDERDCQDIEVAVGEAVTNAILHGRPAGPVGCIRAHCRLTSKSLIVDVADNGGATCLPLPKSVSPGDNEHGRGWMLIHRLMDRVSVRCTKSGLLVRMVKERHAAASATTRALCLMALAV